MPDKLSGVEIEALRLKASGKRLTNSDMAFLVSASARREIGHPPVWYMPEEQAIETVEGTGFPYESYRWKPTVRCKQCNDTLEALKKKTAEDDKQD